MMSSGKNTELVIPVLDKGFVRLENVSASDESVVKAARISYGKGLKDPERDKKLIHYLIKHKHMSPFEHNLFTFHVKAPIFVARQWFRHRIGVGINEISLRYTQYKEDEFYIPDKFRLQDTQNKQGSRGYIEDVETHLLLKKRLESTYNLLYDTYQFMIEKGVSRELARTILPLGSYTQFYWTCNARSLMHFLELRLDEHAQYEIREYAKVLLEFFREYMPISAEAFEKYILNSNIS